MMVQRYVEIIEISQNMGQKLEL